MAAKDAKKCTRCDEHVKKIQQKMLTSFEFCYEQKNSQNQSFTKKGQNCT